MSPTCYMPASHRAPEAAGPMDGPVSMGTSIIAVTFKGGVILGADSRTSTGSYIANRVADKVCFMRFYLSCLLGVDPRMHMPMQITPLADKVYILRSGSAADTQAISSYVQLCKPYILHRVLVLTKVTLMLSLSPSCQTSHNTRQSRAKRFE